MAAKRTRNVVKGLSATSGEIVPVRVIKENSFTFFDMDGRKVTVTIFSHRSIDSKSRYCASELSTGGRVGRGRTSAEAFQKGVETVSAQIDRNGVPWFKRLVKRHKKVNRATRKNPYSEQGVTAEGSWSISITTKYRGATNTRGAKIAVSTEGYPSKTYSYDHSLNGRENHEKAVVKYALANGLRGGKLYGAHTSTGFVWTYTK